MLNAQTIPLCCYLFLVLLTKSQLLLDFDVIFSKKYPFLVKSNDDDSNAMQFKIL